IDDARRDRVDGSRARQWIAQLYYPISPAPVTGVYADDAVLLDVLVAEKYYFATEAQLRGWARKPAAAVAGAAPRTPAALPVVTISPGLGFARLNYAELAAALVARGYIVVVIDHGRQPHQLLGRARCAARDAVALRRRADVGRALDGAVHRHRRRVCARVWPGRRRRCGVPRLPRR